MASKNRIFQFQIYYYSTDGITGLKWTQMGLKWSSYRARVKVLSVVSYRKNRNQDNKSKLTRDKNDQDQQISA